MADEKIERLLEETVKWLRVLAAPTLRSWIEPVLTTTDERKVYQASTGVPRSQVSKAAAVSARTVSNYWKKWTSASPPIIEETEVRGRYRRLYDLHEASVSIEVSS